MRSGKCSRPRADSWVRISSSAAWNLLAAYDDATNVRGVAWNLSTGLYWAHPWDFATLDGPSWHLPVGPASIDAAGRGSAAPRWRELPEGSWTS